MRQPPLPRPWPARDPIARTKEDAYYILGLLPGAVGRKYRVEEPSSSLLVASRRIAGMCFYRFFDNLRVAAQPQHCSQVGCTNPA